MEDYSFPERETNTITQNAVYTAHGGKVSKIFAVFFISLKCDF